MKPRTTVLILCVVNFLIECVDRQLEDGSLATSPSTQLDLPIQPLLTDNQHLRLNGMETIVQLGTGAAHQ